MSLYSFSHYVWVGLASGLALTVASAPALAQLEVTGGGATLNDVDVFVPTDGVLNNGTQDPSDTRAVLYNSTLDEGTLLIETNQGNIPADAVLRINTLPTINMAGNGTDPIDANLPNNFSGSAGQFLGTLSFRSIGPDGASFFNIPTTLEFQVVSPTTLMNGTDLTEYRAEGFILQETGFVTGASGVGAVVRETPVTLVQYQDGNSAASSPEDATVLGNDVPAEAYAAFREGMTYNAGDVELSFQDGDIFTPPGFTLEGTVPDDVASEGIIFDQFVADNSTVTTVSVFGDIFARIIDLPFEDDIEYDDDVQDDDDSDSDDNGDDDDGDDDDIVGDDSGDGTDDGTDGGVDDGTDDGLIGDGSGDGSDDGTDDSPDDDVIVGDGSGNGTDDATDDGVDDGTDDDVVGDGSGDGDDADDDGLDDGTDDGDVVANPNDGNDQFSPIFPGFIGVRLFVFTNVPSGRWVDPPSADGFEYEMTSRDVPVGVASRVFPGMVGVGQADDAVFTSISGFPINVDADDTFVVSVEGTVLGEFSPGDSLDFSDYEEELGDRIINGGVRKFTISEINPTVDSLNPVAFPLKLDFNTATASFEMRALEATDIANTPETAQVSSRTLAD